MEFAQTNLNKASRRSPVIGKIISDRRLKERRYDKYIIQMLEAGHNKTLKDQLVNWEGDKQDKFDQLFNILFTQEYRLVQRASWPLSYIIEKHPSLINKHFSAVTRALGDQNLKDAVKRNLLRCLQTINIPKKYCGKIADACFKFINDPDEKAAIKAFSISILDTLSKTFPELREELILILENGYEYETPAFRSRARKVLHIKSKR